MRRDAPKGKKLIDDGYGIAENIAEEDRASDEDSQEEINRG